MESPEQILFLLDPGYQPLADSGMTVLNIMNEIKRITLPLNKKDIEGLRAVILFILSSFRYCFYFT